jgi:hypothetical protein
VLTAIKKFIFMTENQILSWLLEGDVSIQYQVNRDLLGLEKTNLRQQISRKGWGAKFLSKRKSNGHWGEKFYQPKWTSSHYTLLDLRNLCISKDIPLIKESINLIISNEKGPDGGILPIGQDQKCDVCLNCMFLNYASYFRMEEKKLQSIIDFILAQRMADGGFNCRLNRFGAIHSSLHSTLSVLEGIMEYKNNGFKYRLNELLKAKKSSMEFILEHKLFKSDKTGEIIDKKMLSLSYPSRWRYDILRVLDYFQYAKVKYDERMNDAIEVLLKKRTKEKVWKLQANHPGQFHFHMEQVGAPSRWNTLRALRVLEYFNALE